MLSFDSDMQAPGSHISLLLLLYFIDYDGNSYIDSPHTCNLSSICSLYTIVLSHEESCSKVYETIVAIA